MIAIGRAGAIIIVMALCCPEFSNLIVDEKLRIEIRIEFIPSVGHRQSHGMMPYLSDLSSHPAPEYFF